MSVHSHFTMRKRGYAEILKRETDPSFDEEEQRSLECFPVHKQQRYEKKGSIITFQFSYGKIATDMVEYELLCDEKENIMLKRSGAEAIAPANTHPIMHYYSLLLGEEDLSPHQ